MFARINSLGVYALNGFSVSVEADISGGLPQFTIVGLPDIRYRWRSIFPAAYLRLSW